MSTMFVKLYGERLVNSTLWLECWQSRLVFMSLLALADEHGFVDSPSVQTLAYRLNLAVSDVEQGLAVLEAPDANSRSKELEGRRVTRGDTGWHVVNYRKYREVRTKKQIDGAARFARHYAKTREKALGALELTTLRPDLRVLDLRAESREEGECERETTVASAPDAPTVLATFLDGSEEAGTEAVAKPSTSSNTAVKLENRPDIPPTKNKPAKPPTGTKPRKAPDAAFVALTRALAEAYQTPPAVAGTPKREILKRIRAAVGSGAAADLSEAAWRLVTAAKRSGRPLPWALMDAQLDAPPAALGHITIMSDC